MGSSAAVRDGQRLFSLQPVASDHVSVAQTHTYIVKEKGRDEEKGDRKREKLCVFYIQRRNE